MTVTEKEEVRRDQSTLTSREQFEPQRGPHRSVLKDRWHLGWVQPSKASGSGIIRREISATENLVTRSKMCIW